MRNSLTTMLLAAALIFSFTAESGFAAARVTGVAGVPMPRDVEKILNGAPVDPLVKLGSQVTYKKLNVLHAVFDVSVVGGLNGSTIVLKDKSGGQAVLPKGALIKQAYIQTVIAPSGGTLRFGTNADNDILASTAGASFSASGNGLTIGVPDATVAHMLHVAQDEAVTVSIGGSSKLTAGKLNVFIEYYLGD